MYELEFIEGEGWAINKGDQCYDWGIPTKEEAEKEIFRMENSSSSNHRDIEGALI